MDTNGIGEILSDFEYTGRPCRVWVALAGYSAEYFLFGRIFGREYSGNGRRGVAEADVCCVCAAEVTSVLDRPLISAVSCDIPPFILQR